MFSFSGQAQINFLHEPNVPELFDVYWKSRSLFKPLHPFELARGSNTLFWYPPLSPAPCRRPSTFLLLHTQWERSSELLEEEDMSSVTHVLRNSFIHLPLHSFIPWNSPCDVPGQNTGVGSRSPLQGVFPTQGLTPGLPHCRQILYQMSYQGSPVILEWVAYPFSSRSPNPGIKPGSPAL